MPASRSRSSRVITTNPNPLSSTAMGSRVASARGANRRTARWATANMPEDRRAQARRDRGEIGGLRRARRARIPRRRSPRRAGRGRARCSGATWRARNGGSRCPGRRGRGRRAEPAARGWSWSCWWRRSTSRWSTSATRSRRMKALGACSGTRRGVRRAGPGTWPAVRSDARHRGATRDGRVPTEEPAVDAAVDRDGLPVDADVVAVARVPPHRADCRRRR